MGKQWKQWLTIFLGSKITADGDCSHEIKRYLLLGRKVMTNLDSIFKTIALTRRTFVGKVISLLLNMLSICIFKSFGENYSKEEGLQDGEHMYAHGRFMLMCGRINGML